MVEKENKAWKNLLKRHWQMFILFIIVAITAIIGAIYVFLWFVGDAQSTGLVPKILGSWTMGNLISFILNLIFWEILFIGIPLIIVFALVYLIWWKKLPDTERKEYREGHIFGKRSKRTDGEGAISFLIFVFFVIKVYLDGNWDVAFATWKFDYLINTWLWALVWILIIFGIPILLGAIWWISNKMKK